MTKHIDNAPWGMENVDDLPVNEDLHSQAGLLFAGIDEDGDMEWIGTKEAWNKFEELEKLDK